MTIGYSGVESAALERFHYLIARCEAWQSWCGATEEQLGEAAGIALAEARVHEQEVDNTDRLSVTQWQALRPRAIISVEVDQEIAWSSVFGGKARMVIEASVTLGQTEAEAFRDFGNHLWAVIQAMLVDARADASGLRLNTIRLEAKLQGPFRSNEDRRKVQGDHVWAAVEFSYGPTGVA